MTFDCPDANTTNIKRTVSNTPLQALTTLNAEAFAEAAAALAARVLDGAARDESRIMHAFRLCLARPPEPAEVRTLLELLAEAREWFGSHPDEAKNLAGIHASKTIPSTEMAAWTTTTRIILNMDEMIVRD